jgi:hypothetical protein
VIAHLVLFRPRPALTADERAALVAAFARALGDIPEIRRARIGRRVMHGRGYEQMMEENYSYAAVLEFDDLDALQRYLQHPAHAALGERFFASFESAVIYDYEMLDGADGLAALSER